MKTFTHDGGDVGIRGIFGGFQKDDIMQDMPVYGREGSEYNPDNIK